MVEWGSTWSSPIMRGDIGCNVCLKMTLMCQLATIRKKKTLHLSEALRKVFILMEMRKLTVPYTCTTWLGSCCQNAYTTQPPLFSHWQTAANTCSSLKRIIFGIPSPTVILYASLSQQLQVVWISSYEQQLHELSPTNIKKSVRNKACNYRVLLIRRHRCKNRIQYPKCHQFQSFNSHFFKLILFRKLTVQIDKAAFKYWLKTTD